jgi:hypothetical protein
MMPCMGQQPVAGAPGARAGGDVLVLGAGFSRAVSGRLPLVDELGNACLEVGDLGRDRRVPVGGFTGGSFETWLSRLADEQPYLSVGENLENQALFERFSEAIAIVLGDDVNAALASGCPAWLNEFIRVAHQRRATLVTFNYDPLIECAVATGLLYEWGQYDSVFWAEITGDVPSWPPGLAYLAADKADTLRLLKLHGSLNWYWVPRDASGVSIARRDLPGAFGAPTPYDEEDRRRRLPGRVPFVVPPSAVKSPYYRNPVIREIWQQAAERLRRAERVFILGYSLPPADLTFAGMLTDALRGSTASLAVIDLRAELVQARLTGLGFTEDRVHAFQYDSSPVADFTTWWRDEASSSLADGLGTAASATLDDPMMIVWAKDSYAPVVTVTRNEDVLTLTTDPVSTTREAAARPREDAAQPTLPTLREVIQQLTPAARIEVLTPGGQRQAIIGWAERPLKLGYGRGVWNALTPSGPP